MEKYQPMPIGVSEIVLPENLTSLIEKLAENVHEIWAAERIKEGWTYGPIRNDLKKETPCLVRYADLTENEKNYDRQMVIGTLRTILKFGYKISADAL